MKTCPWCGRNNLDSDEYCFNCERYLDAVPGPEEELRLDRELSRIRVTRTPSLTRMVLSSLLRKVILGILALGGFFIMALLAIWISYDNSTVALVALAVFGFFLLLALYYPDVRVSRKVGMRGVIVALISNVLLLCLALPPALWFLRKRGYIAGIKPVLVHGWWAPVAFVVLGCFLAWMAGRGAAETAAP